MNNVATAQPVLACAKDFVKGDVAASLSSADAGLLAEAKDIRKRVEAFRPKRTLAEIFYLVDFLWRQLRKVSKDDLRLAGDVLNKYFPDAPIFEDETKEEFDLLVDVMPPIDLYLLSTGILSMIVHKFADAIDRVPVSERAGLLMVDRMIYAEYWLDRVIEIERKRPGIVSMAGAVSDMLEEVKATYFPPLRSRQQ